MQAVTRLRLRCLICRGTRVTPDGVQWVLACIQDRIFSGEARGGDMYGNNAASNGGDISIDEDSGNWGWVGTQPFRNSEDAPLLIISG